MRRFAIKRSPWWRPLLVLFGATAARAELAVERERLVARFGWYRLEVPRAQVAAVESVRWPWWGGIGWRYWGGRLGLIGASAPVLCVRLASQHRARLLGIPLRVRELCISVDDPAAVRAALAAHAGTDG